ncbi:MAG: isoprenylcysteine carboxylmethyltransferase family protein [Deltaproteobacteria bacterium]|nr:isoprenylcysteine carboxylmethyltransferase family protein [Deltaproteobacteria bacterium]
MGIDRVKAYALVAIQGAAIVWVLMTGGLFAGAIPLLILQVAGAVLGIWAIAAMGIGNTNISPLVKQDARLITNGPYAFIRHPMYSAVLLAIWPLIADHCTPLRLVAGLILTADLVVKMLYEESLLKDRFAGYETYMEKTKRLIPFVL